ncbi:ChrR family anti-sigma-E factor [Alteromonas sp. C1M14]|uniref:ChrR family anti-sigma-E factor n=1 Tax=Alteromonas sp. C1M14 TaxID=2841567 RepID=UPI001C09FB57|nr:ChrR family anti-sigma-E factor [Alteromonas sp. C1M14]MBU2979048.1 ChrR family anti-sigma-E factor [Alteromonas sp. C1M14]
MARFHPEPEHLLQFAQGSLALSESLIIAAHCDMCTRCQQIVHQHTSILSAEIFDFPVTGEPDPARFDSMFEHITQLPPLKGKIAPTPAQTSIELDGKRFPLPLTLQRILCKTGSWSGLVGKLWQAPVDLDTTGLATFIYMGRGGTVPEHTHRGTEYTLVLDGEFCDELNRYRTGDFISMSHEHIHSPHSDSLDGCLVFSVLDQPLHFTSGLARLLNPFSHLFFR